MITRMTETISQEEEEEIITAMEDIIDIRKEHIIKGRKEKEAIVDQIQEVMIMIKIIRKVEIGIEENMMIVIIIRKKEEEESIEIAGQIARIEIELIVDLNPVVLTKRKENLVDLILVTKIERDILKTIADQIKNMMMTTKTIKRTKNNKMKKKKKNQNKKE